MGFYRNHPSQTLSIQAFKKVKFSQTEKMCQKNAKKFLFCPKNAIIRNLQTHNWGITAAKRQNSIAWGFNPREKGF
jgi:hypothetical protein